MLEARGSRCVLEQSSEKPPRGLPGQRRHRRPRRHHRIAGCQDALAPNLLDLWALRARLASRDPRAITDTAPRSAGPFVRLTKALEDFASGQCRGRRLPMGRRGQGQDRGLAVGARRHRGALPGRPQCRPHPRRGRHHLQGLAAALGRRARQALDHRQWRRGRSLGARRGDRPDRSARRAHQRPRCCASPRTRP